MILEYFRPKTITEAQELLSRKDISVRPLGGGGRITHAQNSDFSVVDLQLLGLDYIRNKAEEIIVGATTTLNALLTSGDFEEDFRNAIKHSASNNLRNTATIAGAIVSGSGNSPILTALLALDADMIWLPEDKSIAIGNWITGVTDPAGVLIKEFTWSKKAIFGYDSVGRSPTDSPFLCVGVSRWSSGRTRIALGSDQLPKPVLVIDGELGDQYELAVKNACSQFINENYISTLAITTIKRILKKGQIAK